ncbi:MAG TPA: alpha/beta hydrolase [Anaerolineales bacterium]|nr:alpha/beta hydrolase [Anaerolineales bacterium]
MKNYPVVQFGGAGTPLHFAHSNGFPPATFSELLDELTAVGRVFALEQRPLWQASSPQRVGWWDMADDLADFLQQQERPLVGMGHSLGAVLTLRVAMRHPEWFRAIVLIDPVFLPSKVLWQWRLAVLLRQRKRHPLYRATVRRQQVFPNQAVMFERFRKARPFAGWSDQAVQNYVNAIALPLPDGQVGLRYPAAWEGHIYTTTPFDLWYAVPRVNVPILLIYGEKSDAFFDESVERFRRLQPNAEMHCITGASHLVPMEFPHQCAEIIKAFLQKH